MHLHVRNRRITVKTEMHSRVNDACWVIVILFVMGNPQMSADQSAPQCTHGFRYPIFPGEYGFKAAWNLSEFRSEILLHAYKSFEAVLISDQLSKLSRYDAFPVTVTCPPGSKIKIIGTGEGVKSACDLQGLVAPCLVYSFGSQGDFEFEADILKSTPCDVHTFDCTYDLSSLDDDNHHHYHKWCLGDRYNHPDSLLSPMFMSYPEIVKELNHSSRTLDVLKLDIEGYEHQALSTLSESTPNLPSQILMELHFAIVDIENLDPFDVKAKTLPHMSIIFAHLSNLGYAIFNRADNVMSPFGDSSEFSFLRVEGTHHSSMHRQGRIDVIPHG